MVVCQGDIFWADLSEPIGSQPGFRRPVVVVQSDAFNRSSIATVVCVPLTSNMALARFPGNESLPPRSTGLAKASVANVSQILTLDRAQLDERVGSLSRGKLAAVLAGIDVVLGK
ncbi:MAG: type II toxin-antitoxin system PemK/MazF family toxin [Polyangiaceae bacterium]|nr:type II toxin-antitoxin system PemK/MazF family toxin [Polyangiaceae bacterium]